MAEETIGVGQSSVGTLRGQTLGPYQLEAQIGRGGMAVVYRAVHVPLDRVVALKLLLPSLAGDKEFVDRFLAEARAAARLDNAHIVPIYDSGAIDDHYYIAMKLLEGRDLKTVLAERRTSVGGGLPLERVIGIITQVADALDYAHQHHLVHRDIKPANIIVDERDHALLTDFGISRAVDRASVTLTGIVIGTPAYMSPEQAQARPVDYRSDLYSLGVVCYELLVGTTPFAGNPQSVMFAQVNSPPPALDEVNPDIPPAVAQVIQRALAKNPDERYQSAGALATALSNAARQNGDPSATIADDPGATLILPHVPTGSPETAAGTRAFVPAPTRRGARVIEEAPTVAGPRPRRWLLLGLGSALAVALIAALIWFVFASSIASGDGHLTVTSDPAGATVTVDGNVLGTTPLASTKLRTGKHTLSVDRPTYARVQRTEQISSGATDKVSLPLTPLPAASVLAVKNAIVATEIGQDSSGAITFGSIVTSVKAGQEFGMIVTLAQTTPGVRDVTANYTIALFDASGNRLRGSPPATLTVKKGDAQGQSVAFKFTFEDPKSVGNYQLKFFIDDKELASKPITLVSGP